MKALIVGPAWVGDMVMAQSLFKWLRRRHPGAIIDVVAPAWSEPLLARMPEVRRSIVLPVDHGDIALRRRWRLGVALRDERYTHAIVLPRSWKSALVPFAAEIPDRTGFRGEWRYGLLTDVRRLDRRQLDQTVKRFAALGAAAGDPPPVPPHPSLTVDTSNLDRLRQEFRLARAPTTVALMPGAAYGPAKCWPLESFATLASILVNAGVAVWVLGGEADRAAGAQICDAAGEGAVNLCGRTGLADVVDLLAATDAAITNDSGLMHVAAASGTHVVAIYGSSSPDFTPPLTETASIEYLSLDCSPCFKRECPLGHLRCLRDISPERIATHVLT